MQLVKDNFISRSEWLNFLHTSDSATPFQSPQYYDLVNAVPELTAKAYAVLNEGKPEALSVVTIQKEQGLKGYFSRRGIIYGGILTRNEEALSILLEYINEELKTDVIYAETRNSNNYAQYKSAFNKYGWLYQPELNYHLDCSDEQTAWKNFNSSRKRQIRKALKNGAVIGPAADIEEVKQYYIILKNLYASKVKKPLAPFEFFRQMYITGFANFLLVRKDHKVIGGIVAPFLENKCIYELYVCGLDQEYKEYYPSVLATYAAVEYGYRNGLRCFDFMGAGSPDDDYGVREFKSKFGGKEVENGRFIRIFNPPLYNIGKIAVSKLKWLVK